MDKRSKFWLSIGLIGLSFVFNMILFKGMILKQPIFLKHYYEIQLEQATGWSLYCIMNRADEREVKSIEFPEMKGDGHCFNVEKGNEFSLNAHHDQKEYRIEYWYTGGDNKIEEEVHLTQARVTFNNGEVMQISIGQIIFYPNHNKGEEEQVLRYTSGSASSSGEMNSNGIFTTDVEFLEIKSTLDFLVQDLIEIQINGEEPTPRSFKKGDLWILEGKFQIGEDNPRRFEAYQIQKRIYFRKEADEIVTERILNLKHTPYLSSRESYDYLRKVGAIR